MGNPSMSEIVLSSEQASVLAGAEDEVLVKNPSGMVVGRIVTYATREQIEEAQRVAASGRATRTSAEVWDHIRSLERT